MVKTVKLTVAIDGPAGAGKSTIAKLIADKFNLMYINTGSMYRAVTLEAIDKGIESSNIEGLCSLIDEMNISFSGEKLLLNGEDINYKLSLPQIAQKVPVYAEVPEVRSRLIKLQQKMSEQYDVIMDGRDIGTVVLKNAKFKFFLTASPEKRAMRRFKELTQKGIKVEYDRILQDIIQRDYMDTNRKVGPLIKAEDAIEIDTSEMTISEVAEKICTYINNKVDE